MSEDLHIVLSNLVFILSDSFHAVAESIHQLFTLLRHHEFIVNLLANTITVVVADFLLRDPHFEQLNLIKTANQVVLEEVLDRRRHRLDVVGRTIDLAKVKLLLDKVRKVLVVDAGRLDVTRALPFIVRPLEFVLELVFPLVWNRGLDQSL